MYHILPIGRFSYVQYVLLRIAETSRVASNMEKELGNKSVFFNPFARRTLILMMSSAKFNNKLKSTLAFQFLAKENRHRAWFSHISHQTFTLHRYWWSTLLTNLRFSEAARRELSQLPITPNSQNLVQFLLYSLTICKIAIYQQNP